MGHFPTGTEVLDELDRHTEMFLATVGGLSADDLGGPSLCAGWTRGHVVAHVARNAEGIGNLATWALTGARLEMYAGGAAGRDAAIEAAAWRPPLAQVEDVGSTAAALRPLLTQLLTDEVVTSELEGRGGMVVRADRLGFMRLREVVFHHVDLDAGFGFEQVGPQLVGPFLDDAVARQSGNGLHVTLDDGERTLRVGDGGPTVSGTPAALLSWLARQDPSGVHSARPLPEIPKGN